MRQPGVVVVGQPDDRLAAAVTTSLRSQGVWAHDTVPGALALLQITVDGDVLEVEHKPIGGVFFRSFPDVTFSEGFVESDRAFSDSEVSATWLAATHLSSVLTINRSDATTWFEGLRWTVWRRRLLEAGIDAADVSFGATNGARELTWYPYTSTQPEAAPDMAVRRVLAAALSASTPQQASLVVCGQVVAGEALGPVMEAAQLLYKQGVLIAEVATDSTGRIVSIDTLPSISKPASLAQATSLVSQHFHAHLHRW